MCLLVTLLLISALFLVAVNVVLFTYSKAVAVSQCELKESLYATKMSYSVLYGCVEDQNKNQIN